MADIELSDAYKILPVARKMFKLRNPPKPKQREETKAFLTPHEAMREICRTAVVKTKTEWHRLAISSFMAGAYLAIGGQLAVTVGGGVPTLDPGLQKLLFAAMFPVGLIFQILTGSELITGNFMFFSVGWASNRVRTWDVAKNWLIVWWGNWLGAITTSAFLAYFTNSFLHDPYHAYIMKLAVTKTTQGFGIIVLKGIGCNLLVCMAAYLAIAGQDQISKLFGIYFAIFTFVGCGYEHVVANGFYISNGIYYGADTDFGRMFYKNLIPVTIGNLIGGGLFMGIFNWYISGMTHKKRYHKRWIVDKLLTPYWYWKIFNQHVLKKEVDDDEPEDKIDDDEDEKGSEMKERPHYSDDSSDEDAYVLPA
eukprot:TRINITY_DN10744_c0_g1_i1.p1 TRINITY_DN10744_c0_g1~~TRINITY_DN10744_c0_g1_i1.p1  ORF type:complete len:365 (-),score=66.18 TRINITY_DN10744_c0_g1_i1:100-1194(-)